MIETPRITETPARSAAVIHLTVPRSEIQNVMGPGLKEIIAGIAAQGITPTGPWFTHHFKNPSATFDFEICVPVATPVAAGGRMKPSQLPTIKVAQAVYQGGYKGLAAAWGELETWIAANGYKSAPDLWECYLLGPQSSSDPANWRTELTRPLIGLA